MALISTPLGKIPTKAHIRAWCEHLGLTQAEVASRLGISQAAYSQHENSQTLRKSTRIKMANALGLRAEQLDF